MAATYADLKNEVYGHCYGYARDQEQVTYLSTATTSSDTTLYLGDAAQVGKGVIEIDDEMIWLLSTTRTANTATVAPSWGRGYLGSTAAAHSQYARVTAAPRFPRLTISNTINEVIAGVYPTLYGIGQSTFTWNASVTTYALASAADRVLNIEWELPGPSNEWAGVRRWRELLSGDGGVNEITIYDSIVPGRTVRVNYAKKPTALSSDSDTLVSTGLAESARDVIVYGAVGRLVMLSESGRLQSRAIESSELNEDVQTGSSTTIGKRFLDLYQQRLNEERNRLLSRFPPSIHLTR